MLVALGIVLAIAWILGFTVMKVTSFALHLLLLFAVASIIFHFVKGRAKSPP